MHPILTAGAPCHPPQLNQCFQTHTRWACSPTDPHARRSLPAHASPAPCSRRSLVGRSRSSDWPASAGHRCDSRPGSVLLPAAAGSTRSEYYWPGGNFTEKGTHDVVLSIFPALELAGAQVMPVLHDVGLAKDLSLQFLLVALNFVAGGLYMHQNRP